MLHDEWPLLIFTLLAQAAAGLYLAVVLVRECLAAAKSGEGVTGALKATRVPALVAGVMLAIGVVISLVHLGTPAGAYRALGNLGSSWLAREILGNICFGLLWLLAFVLELKQIGGLWTGRLAALAGIVLVFVMGELYMASIIPAWMSGYTLVAFLAATLVLGGVLAIALTKAPAVTPIGAVMVLAGVAAQLIGLPVYLAQLGRGVAAAGDSLAVLLGDWQPALWLELGLVAATAVAVGVIWQRKQRTPWVLYAVLIIGVAGEALARTIFYAMGVPIHVY
jgi:anaerobic dimethyl sulfoxide reductase subunit C (anchor subunit)